LPALTLKFALGSERRRHRLAAATLSVPKPFTVARDGFSLNAAVACAPHQRTDAVRYIDNLLAQPN